MYVFVGGTPASGKTYTVREFIKNSNLEIEYIGIDDLREEFSKDSKLRYWVDFFWNKNEEQYWKSVTYEEAISNLIQQSAAFWPKIKEKITQVMNSRKNAIFEGVNLLPHLVKDYLDIPALFLILEDQKLLLDRIRKDPRWGTDHHLQEAEAEHFIKYDARFIKEQAQKYGYRVIDNPAQLVQELNRIFKVG